MSDCTHHWAVTSPCPFCQQAKIERLTDEVKALRAYYNANNSLERCEAIAIIEALPEG